jgi:endo-1,4-beta-xylanase
VYGWTRRQLVEYRIIESYEGASPNGDAEVVGTTECNGATYELSQVIRVDQPSIEGMQTFPQFWSIREPKLPTGEVSGAVDTACHIAAWKELGLELGTQASFQLFATEAVNSSGSATITIS